MLDTKGPLSLETIDKLREKNALPSGVLDKYAALAKPKEPSKMPSLVDVGKTIQDQGSGLLTPVMNTVADYGNKAMGFKELPQEEAGNSFAPADSLATNPEALAEQQRMDQLKLQKDMIERSTAGIVKGYGWQQGSLRKSAEAGMKQAAAESAYLQKMDEDLTKRRETEATVELDRKARLDEKMSMLNQSVEAFSAMPKTTQEAMDKMGTGTKIMSGLALFLGAAPNSSGQNKALQVLQTSVDKAVEAQKADINNKDNLVGRMRQLFGDERAAEAAARMAYINDAGIKLQQIASQYKGPQIMANAQAMMAQIEVAKQKEINNFARAMEVSPSLMGMDDMTRKIMALPKELQKQAFAEKGIVEALEQGKKTLQDQINTIKDTGGIAGNMPFTTDKAKVDAAKSGIMTVLVANWKGPMSDTDLARIDGLMPKVTDTSSQAEAKGKQLIRVLENNSKPTPTLKGFKITGPSDPFAGLNKSK